MDTLSYKTISEINSYMKRFPQKYEIDASRNLIFVEFKEEATPSDEQALKTCCVESIHLASMILYA